MTIIPIIDIDRDPAAVGHEIDETLRSVGFFQISGHGVPADVADAAWEAARAFFDLPLDEKLTVERQPGDLYGYFPMLSESLARSVEGTGVAAPGDLKESLNIAPITRPTHPMADETEAALFATNAWPAALPGLRPALEAYFTEMVLLSERLMSLFALGLGLPPEFFADKIDVGASALRLLDYPPGARLRARPASAAPSQPGQLRAGAHTDYGTLTILRQELGRSGLEVFDETSGEWLGVPAIEDAYVINIGDLMARWTNDRWMSTLHRVTDPDAGADVSQRRQSMPFFHNANYSQLVACLPTCIGDGAKYEPVLAGPHLAGKTMRSAVTM
ncbi:MAG TPA: 2-oxoglutarate and iron-dependent oxygenase domain-containing protein [Jatrophihabitans sp.]